MNAGQNAAAGPAFQHAAAGGGPGQARSTDYSLMRYAHGPVEHEPGTPTTCAYGRIERRHNVKEQIAGVNRLFNVANNGQGARLT